MRPSLRRRRQAGAFDFILMLWVVLGVSVLYLGFVFIPAYSENWDIKAVVREGANKGWTGMSDEKIKEFIINRCKTLGHHFRENDDGSFESAKGTILEEDDIEITRDEVARKITIVVTYKKRVVFPFTKKDRILTLTPSATEGLDPVDWNK